jgi:hypothetical protein
LLKVGAGAGAETNSFGSATLVADGGVIVGLACVHPYLFTYLVSNLDPCRSLVNGTISPDEICPEMILLNGPWGGTYDAGLLA